MTEREAIKEALKAIPNVKLVDTKWPEQFKTTPCIIFNLAGETGEDFRDDKEYLTELEWYVRVFAAKEADLWAIADAAKEAMEGLGYVRTFRWEEPGTGIRQVAIRMKKYI